MTRMSQRGFAPEGCPFDFEWMRCRQHMCITAECPTTGLWKNSFAELDHDTAHRVCGDLLAAVSWRPQSDSILHGGSEDLRESQDLIGEWTGEAEIE